MAIARVKSRETKSLLATLAFLRSGYAVILVGVVDQAWLHLMGLVNWFSESVLPNCAGDHLFSLTRYLHQLVTHKTFHQ